MALTWHLRVLHDTVVGPRLPDGVQGVRDVDSPCEWFDPAPRMGVGDCSTDGHYLCIECIHLNLTSDYAYQNGGI